MRIKTLHMFNFNTCFDSCFWHNFGVQGPFKKFILASDAKDPASSFPKAQVVLAKLLLDGEVHCLNEL